MISKNNLNKSAAIFFIIKFKQLSRAILTNQQPLLKFKVHFEITISILMF